VSKQDTTPMLIPLDDLTDMSYQEVLDSGVIDISEVDDVTTIEQEQLVGVPIIVLGWDEREGDFGPFVAVRVKTETGNHVFSDGGTGIKAQLERYVRRIERKGLDIQNGIRIPNGLKASHYNYTDPITGKSAPAVTYYLDNRASK